jgi:hypothetical protein
MEGQNETPESPAAQELDELRTEVQRLTHALEIAEVKNAGLERIVETQQLALRALEKAPSNPTPPAEPQQPTQTPPARPKSIFDVEPDWPTATPRPRGLFSRIFQALAPSSPSFHA